MLKLQLRASGDQGLALVVAGVLHEVLDEAASQILRLGLPLGSIGVGVARASCKAESENETVTGENVSGAETVVVGTTADNSAEIFEAMKKAAADGEYTKALDLYKSGAADVANAEVLDWYYYSLAMAEYTQYGCIGYPVNLMQYYVGNSFEPAKKATEDMKSCCSMLNGIYEYAGRYLYVVDGKIAVSIGEHLSGSVFCNAAIAEKDGSFYYADRKSDGTHALIYTVEKTEEGNLVLTATADNKIDLYSGEYLPVGGSLPELIY